MNNIFIKLIATKEVKINVKITDNDGMNNVLIDHVKFMSFTYFNRR